MSIYYEGSRREFLELLGQFDDPAFVRRARQVEAAERGLVASCRAARDELLTFAKMRLAFVGAFVDREWSRLGPLLLDASDGEYLGGLYDEWRPVLRSRVEPTGNARKIRGALRELAASFDAFNRKWSEFVAGADLSDVNQARDGYNKFYVIEKACAFQSERIAKHGFQPLPPFSTDDLLAELPLLRVPGIR